MMKFSRAIGRVKRLSGEQTSTLRTRTEMVFETLVFSPFDPTESPREFIILSRRESNKSH
jgi:hypothetical protein